MSVFGETTVGIVGGAAVGKHVPTMRFSISHNHDRRGSSRDREFAFAAYGNDSPERRGPAI